MKTLVIILGETRASKFTYKSCFDNLIKPLNADVCICIGTNANYDYTDKFYNIAKYKFILENEPEEFEELFGEAYKEIIEEYKNDLEQPHIHWREYLKLNRHFTGGILKNISGKFEGACGILIYFRWFLLKNLIKNNLINIYDRFIITRSDFKYTLEHPKMKILDPEYIWIPNAEDYGGYTDRHVILSKTNIIDYLNIFNNMVIKSNTYYNKIKNDKNIDNIEQIIKFNLIENKVEHLVKRMPYIMYAVKDPTIKKMRWIISGFMNEDKYIIKYINEFFISKYNEIFYKRHNFKNINDFYKRYLINSFDDLENNRIELYDKLFNNRKTSTKNILNIYGCIGCNIKILADYFNSAKIINLNYIEDLYKQSSILSNDRIITYDIKNNNNNIFKNDTFDIIIINFEYDINKLKKLLVNLTNIVKKEGIIMIETVYNENNWMNIIIENTKNIYSHSIFNFDESNTVLLLSLK